MFVWFETDKVLAKKSLILGCVCMARFCNLAASGVVREVTRFGFR